MIDTPKVRRLNMYLTPPIQEQIALVRVVQGITTDTQAVYWALNNAVRNMAATQTDIARAQQMVARGDDD